MGGAIGDGAHETIARVVTCNVVGLERRRRRELAEERMVARWGSEAGLRFERSILTNDGLVW